MRDRQLAFAWHAIEFCVVLLLALSVVGLHWSWTHLHPALIETKRPAR